MKTLLGLLITTMLTVSTDNDIEILKVVSFQSKPIVEARLNGKKAYFMLDTGAELSIISSDATRDYGFRIYETSQAIKMIGFGGKRTQVLHVGNVELILGQCEVQTKLFSFNIEAIVKAVKFKTGYKIVGIIGTDMMKKYGFMIDYNDQTVKMINKHKNAYAVK